MRAQSSRRLNGHSILAALSYFARRESFASAAKLQPPAAQSGPTANPTNPCILTPSIISLMLRPERNSFIQVVVEW